MLTILVLVYANFSYLVDTKEKNGQDDSREAASTIFPSMSSLLKRKKDHG